MSRLVPVVAILLTACTPPDSNENRTTTSQSPKPAGQIDPGQFVGKPFSNLVAKRREFLIRRRAVSRAALGAYSAADGIELPGQLRRIEGRDVLVFFTCRMDRCSSASNVILVDPSNMAMQVVNFTEGRSTVIVDGPPDLAEFARLHCKGTSCRASGAN